MLGYSCYGLSVASGLELPDLGRSVDPGPSPDITIVEAPVAPRPDDAPEVLDGLWCLGASTWLDVPGVATFEVHDGSRVTFEREPGVADGDVRLFLLGTALGAIMWQRGHLVLHGNAFAVAAGAAVVVGRSGAGKSTLAAELDRRGHQVLSDDVVPIDDEGLALPGYPRIKLWEDAVERLGRRTDELERITASHAKFHVPVSRGVLSPVPAHWIYVLDTHDGTTLELEHVSGSACFDLLSAHTYRRELASGAAESWQHLQRCAALASRARIVRVRRPVSTMSPADTAEAILDDIARHPPGAGARDKEQS